MNQAEYVEAVKAARKVKNTRAQSKALREYNFALQQEDRYLGSVFVTPVGQAKVEGKTRAAYEVCMSLGMTWENGL